MCWTFSPFWLELCLGLSRETLLVGRLEGWGFDKRTSAEIVLCFFVGVMLSCLLSISIATKVLVWLDFDLVLAIFISILPLDCFHFFHH